MTDPWQPFDAAPQPVPSWLTAEWNIHAARAGAHWCSVCESYLVPVEGAVCPCCSSTSQWEATA